MGDNKYFGNSLYLNRFNRAIIYENWFEITGSVEFMKVLQERETWEKELIGFIELEKSQAHFSPVKDENV